MSIKKLKNLEFFILLFNKHDMKYKYKATNKKIKIKLNLNSL